MNIKLIFRNTKRYIKDYLIYIVTTSMCAGILVAFLSIAFSPHVINLAENMINVQKILTVLSVFLMIIFSFLINYAMKFIIKRRKKEFGIYMLLGFYRKDIIKFFLTETMVIGAASFLIGLPFGLVIYQILNRMIMNLFDVPYSFSFTISSKVIILAFLLFSIMYVICAIKSAYMFSHLKIKQLIYGARYNEVHQITNLKCKIIQISFFLLLSIISIFILINSFTQDSNIIFIFILIALVGVIIGIYGVHYNYPVTLYLSKKFLQSWSYKGTNMFLIGQINSKVNSTAKVMAYSATLLTIALILLMAGLSIGAAYKSNIEYEAPFDITVAIDANIVSFEDVIAFIESQTDINDYVEYKIYHTNESDVKNVPIIKLSDYNHLRELIGLDSKSITSSQFIMHSEVWNIRDDIIKELSLNNDVMINGINLEGSSSLVFGEPFEQMRTNGNQGFIMVVPDYVYEDLESYKSRLVVSTVMAAPQELKHSLNNYVRNDWTPEIKGTPIQHNGKITLFISVKSWSVANGLTGLLSISLSSIYISLILFLIVGTVLSLQQSSENIENKYRFTLLNNIGVTEEDSLSLIKKQIIVYFALPAVLPMILTLIFGIFMNLAFQKFILEENIIIYNTYIALAIFLSVYGCYMFLSYKIFKNTILYKKKLKQI